MFEELRYLISEFFKDLGWFGETGNQVVMGSFEFVVLLLGNNVFMVLITFFLASRWGAERERKKDNYAKTKIEREYYARQYDRRIL